MSRSTKEKLDRLQAKLFLRYGRKMTKEELLRRLLDHAGSAELDFLSASEGIRYPLPDEVIERIKSRSSDWGVVTRSEEIDKYLYGDKAE
jgi:adenylate kinase family enzyme